MRSAIRYPILLWIVVFVVILFQYLILLQYVPDQTDTAESGGATILVTKGHSERLLPQNEESSDNKHGSVENMENSNAEDGSVDVKNRNVDIKD